MLRFVCLHFPFYFILLRSTFHMEFCLLVGPVHCARDPLPLWPKKFSPECVCQWVSCTIHGTHKPFFLTKFLLKMGVMALFIHLNTSLTKWFREGRVQLYNVHCPLSTCHNSCKIKVVTVNKESRDFYHYQTKQSMSKGIVQIRYSLSLSHMGK